MIECQEPAQQVERLRAIMHRLRAPGGCSWDAEQTHESLISCLIEEAYETVDAIQKRDENHLKEELGDLLLQVVFHSELAAERGSYDLDQVAHGICEKLIRRHPHVYGSAEADSPDQVLKQWDQIKKEERGETERSYLYGTGKGLPSLLKAAKLQKKAGKVGFDWPSAESILTKVDEELSEVREEFEGYEEGSAVPEKLQAELGDLLFIVVNVVRKLGLDPEATLERTNRKFENRFAEMEKALLIKDFPIAEASVEQMNEEWEKAKEIVA